MREAGRECVCERERGREEKYSAEVETSSQLPLGGDNGLNGWITYREKTKCVRKEVKDSDRQLHRNRGAKATIIDDNSNGISDEQNSLVVSLGT